MEECLVTGKRAPTVFSFLTPRLLVESKRRGGGTTESVLLIYLFLPLILKSEIRKVAVITSRAANLPVARRYEVGNSPVYSASKAAINMMVAKFHAQYKKDGVVFLSICPGHVSRNTGIENRE
ncbi:hypothetical protein MAPG_10980 [Magnaporthiopsis poae ATCC 64411]|uniref:Uncharacterized protein n=1 Tax=Magnaporthiopsis poae (strain ATCC 64411 / 73-15) TaxID=644358 RepID=A0A0C4EE16_MAGP6|nr:hypothetical protein MAPG_10980 [Magnaporthiopsis poae ATCC 64411]